MAAVRGRGRADNGRAKKGVCVGGVDGCGVGLVGVGVWCGVRWGSGTRAPFVHLLRGVEMVAVVVWVEIWWTGAGGLVVGWLAWCAGGWGWAGWVGGVCWANGKQNAELQK